MYNKVLWVRLLEANGQTPNLSVIDRRKLGLDLGIISPPPPPPIPPSSSVERPTPPSPPPSLRSGRKNICSRGGGSLPEFSPVSRNAPLRGRQSPPPRLGLLDGRLVGGLGVGAVLDQVLRYDGSRLDDSPRPDGEREREGGRFRSEEVKRVGTGVVGGQAFWERE